MFPSAKIGPRDLLVVVEVYTVSINYDPQKVALTKKKKSVDQLGASSHL